MNNMAMAELMFSAARLEHLEFGGMLSVFSCVCESVRRG